MSTLHLHQHFVTVYISQDYWTLSDPLHCDPDRRYPIHTWERHLHSSLTRIHAALGLPTPTLPHFRKLVHSLSLQRDGREGA